jgi:hypothetical protein
MRSKRLSDVVPFLLIENNPVELIVKHMVLGKIQSI